MKNTTTRLITAIAVSLLLACEPEQDILPASEPPTTIIIDLEEEHFLFEGHWYPWAISIMQCSPAFSLDLNWEEGILTIKHCQAALGPALENIVLYHSTCPDANVMEFEIREERSILNYIAQIPTAGITCLRQEDSWLELQLEWE